MNRETLFNDIDEAHTTSIEKIDIYCIKCGFPISFVNNISEAIDYKRMYEDYRLHMEERLSKAMYENQMLREYNEVLKHRLKTEEKEEK